MSSDLVFLAGKKALSIIKDEGLEPERVKVMAGAAGGPKWLVLNGLDRVIFSSWLKGRTRPLSLVGSSIGAWRFAAASCTMPRKTIDKFESAYIQQSYSSKPSPDDVSEESKKILDDFLDDKGIAEILDHPYLRLNIMAVKCRWPVSSDNKTLLALGLAGAFFSNLAKRTWLNFFFKRTLFHHPKDKAQFLKQDGFRMAKAAFENESLKPVLLASGSIPLVMSGVKDIPGVPHGTYRDGGVIDYHMDLPFQIADDSIILFPHYTDRIIPGWFDKKLPWRKPGKLNMDNVVMVAPSREFVERLPGKKIPDRHDFWLFKGKDRERIDYWNTVVNMSESLAHEFITAVEKGVVKEQVKPLDV